MTIVDDTLARLEELWESAEQGAPQEGDTYISRNETEDCAYAIGVARWELNPTDHRILERAKPKAPEWEAVVASYLHGDDHKREVYFRTRHGGWESETRLAGAGDLVDPVPLVEMPGREELEEALVRGYDAWAQDLESVGGADGHRADAVLELLERR